MYFSEFLSPHLTAHCPVIDNAVLSREHCPKVGIALGIISGASYFNIDSF